jgi:hypothetical protein
VAEAHNGFAGGMPRSTPSWVRVIGRAEAWAMRQMGAPSMMLSPDPVEMTRVSLNPASA